MRTSIDAFLQVDSHLICIDPLFVILLTSRQPRRITLFPYTTLFRSPRNEREMALELLLGLDSKLLPYIYMILGRSEEHTSELQSPDHLVCRLLLEKKNNRLTPQSAIYMTMVPC